MERTNPNGTSVAIRADNPLLAVPQEPSGFFDGIPTSADFMEPSGRSYSEKVSKLSESRPGNLSLVTSGESTPNQLRVERSLVERGADPEEIEAYLAYKNATREEILEPKKALVAVLNLPPEDEPIIEDFLLMAHRNNVGYALTVPKGDGSASTVYRL